MENVHKGYLVNIGQARISDDKKARIHKLSFNQPVDCQIDSIKDGLYCETSAEAVSLCSQKDVDYKFCAHCVRDGV